MTKRGGSVSVYVNSKLDEGCQYMLTSSPIYIIRVAHGVGTAAKKERSGRVADEGSEGAA